MAVIQYGKAGINKFKLSIIKEEWLNRDNYDNGNNFEKFIDVFGPDLVPLITQTSSTATVNLMLFTDGSKVILEKTADVVIASSSTTNYYACYCKFYYVTNSGTKKELFFPAQALLYYTENNIKTYYKMFLGVAEVDGNLVGSLAYVAGGMYSVVFYSGKDYLSNLPKKVFDGIEFDSDPWSEAGYAGIAGGGGTFDFKSDTIALPTLPTIDAVSSGFLQLFTGGLNKVLELSRYMWSTNFFDSIVKITSNPIDIIMGLYMYPFIVPASTQKYIRAGNVITNIAMGVPDSQMLEIDCGNVDIPLFYGAYLDYEPFTKCDLFLPYCGTFPLSMDDIAGKTINVKYRVDLLTGVCGAYVIVDDTVKYNFTGTCAINIPISSRSFENIYNSILGIVGSMHGGSSFGLPSVGSIAGAVTSGKNQVQHGGVCSSNAGYLGVQNPYLIFSIPNVAIPKGLNKYTGYPIYATYKLSDLNGYTEIEDIHLENMGTATKEEIDKIISMLEGGVIL